MVLLGIGWDPGLLLSLRLETWAQGEIGIIGSESRNTRSLNGILDFVSTNYKFVSFYSKLCELL